MKKCFVVSQIGDEGSETRKRADNVFKYIISPPCESKNYKAIRADHLDSIGLVSKIVVVELLTSDLVIADLTGHNPNVFYEVATRHFTGKPIILIMAADNAIPFNISHMKILKYDLSDLESVEHLKEKIVKIISEIDPDKVYENPITEVINDDNYELQLPHKNIAKIVSGYDKILRKNIEIVETAKEIIFTTGSRSRDKAYLDKIEERLKENYKIIYYRILYGNPKNKLLKTHLLNIFEFRSPEDRETAGYQTFHLGLLTDDYYYPEWFICANEKRALIVLPSLSGEGKYDTAIAFSDKRIVDSYRNFVHQLFCVAREILASQEVEAMEVTGRRSR